MAHVTRACQPQKGWTRPNSASNITRGFCSGGDGCRRIRSSSICNFACAARTAIVGVVFASPSSTRARAATIGSRGWRGGCGGGVRGFPVRSPINPFDDNGSIRGYGRCDAVYFHSHEIDIVIPSHSYICTFWKCFIFPSCLPACSLHCCAVLIVNVFKYAVWEHDAYKKLVPVHN